MVRYFFDTYALIEIISQNSKYEPYLDHKTVTSQQNLVELYYYLFTKHGERTAKHFYEKFKRAVVQFSDEAIFEAVKFRKEHIKKRLSYVDCLGYAYAKIHKIKFLTGDKEFKDLPNVEFVA